MHRPILDEPDEPVLRPDILVQPDRGAIARSDVPEGVDPDALNRVGRAQVVPVLGREVEERQQGLGVLGQAGGGGCVFGPVFFREDLDSNPITQIHA